MKIFIVVMTFVQLFLIGLSRYWAACALSALKLRPLDQDVNILQSLDQYTFYDDMSTYASYVWFAIWLFAIAALKFIWSGRIKATIILVYFPIIFYALLTVV